MSSKTPECTTIATAAAPAMATKRQAGLAELKDLILRKDPRFFSVLRDQTLASSTCEDILLLSSLRKRAAQRGLVAEQQPLRVAVIGGYTLYPLNELIGHYLAAARYPV